MLVTYEATHVGVNQECDALIVAFGGLPDANNHPTVYFMLQRSTDKHEDQPGIDGVHVEWCNQSQSCCGCIESFLLNRQSARIIFTEEANFLLELHENVEKEATELTELLITFDLDHEKFAQSEA